MLVRDDEELLDLLRGGQRVFNVVALSGVKGDVDSAIVQIVGDTSSGDVHASAKESAPPPARPANLA